MLQKFESKYSFWFIGVGDDWLILQLNNTPADLLNLAEEYLKVCPIEDMADLDKFSKVLLEDNNQIFMWWD